MLHWTIGILSLPFLRKMVVETCQRVCELCPGEKIGSFVAVDYVLFALVLVVSALIGVFYMIKEYRAAKQMTSDDVLMGGRDIGIFPIAMSLMASFMGAITVLGTPTEMYNNNTSYWLAGMAMLITVPLTNHIFLPFFHDLSLTSAYEVSQWYVHTRILFKKFSNNQIFLYTSSKIQEFWWRSTFIFSSTISPKPREKKVCM